MINTLLGSKMRMSQTFIEGTRVPMTWIKTGPCVVTQVKTMERDGYWSVQLGFSEKKLKNVTKPLQGHLKGAIKDNKAPRFLREVRFTENPDLKVGDVVKLTSLFRKGDVVSVAGISKGKGFAGAVKRHHFKGGPKTHGQSDRHRAPGSIGQGTTPGRVLKNKKMAGRMGSERITVKNLIVVDLDPEKDLLAVSGPNTFGN
jgi:large subunit ribosomal protein L3